MRFHLLYISAISVFLSCSAKEETVQETSTVVTNNVVQLTDAQMKNAGLVTDTISLRNITSQLRVSGKVDVPPQHLVSVSAPMGGYLRSTKLLPGMHVNKGEVLAVLEDPQYIQLQQDYLLAKSKLHFAQLEYNRQRELNASQASSDKVTQQAQAEMNSQRITMNALAQQLRMINISPEQLSEGSIRRSIQLRSTINGYVSKVNVNIGRYINPSDILFELINPTDIHLNISVYEKDVSKLYIGQKLYAYTNANPNKKYLCEVLLISKDVRADGSTEVHCHFENYDKTLLPGMYMNADIAINTNTSFALPAESIVSFEGKDYVFVNNGAQQYKMTPVEKGVVHEGFTAITGENLKGKAIVTKGAYTLLMALKNSDSEE